MKTKDFGWLGVSYFWPISISPLPCWRMRRISLTFYLLFWSWPCPASVWLCSAGTAWGWLCLSRGFWTRICRWFWRLWGWISSFCAILVLATRIRRSCQGCWRGARWVPRSSGCTLSTWWSTQVCLWSWIFYSESFQPRKEVPSPTRNCSWKGQTLTLFLNNNKNRESRGFHSPSLHKNIFSLSTFTPLFCL